MSHSQSHSPLAHALITLSTT